MKRVIGTLASVLLLATAAGAGEKKTYQVTGPVVSVTDTAIVVTKGKDNWTIAKDTATKGPAVKPGDKVTIYYRMTATEIEKK